MMLQNSDARKSISLNGKWDVIIDPYENGYYNHRYEENPAGYFQNQIPKDATELIEYSFAAGQKLAVPGDWNTQDDRLFFYEGTIWYHRGFALAKQPDKRYILYFGAVNYSAIVYVNGQKVGTHQGGFTSFQFDVTDFLASGHNFVVVKVDNRRERDRIPTVNTDWWNYGGITRPVKLVEVDRTYVADYSVQYEPDNSIVGWVEIGGDVPDAYEDVLVTLPELVLSTSVTIDQSGRGEFRFNAAPILWSPTTPKLYQVVLAYQGIEVVDRIGFRTIAVRGEDILLNGEPIFLRGISIHEEVPIGDGRAWSLEDARTLLTWAKELNCNFVRLAHYPHNETMVRLADEMGLLVWSEIPVYWTILFEREDVYTLAEQQLREMIGRDKNRAAIILWSMANETPNHEERLRFLTRLADAARAMDPSRLITAAMDTQGATEHGKAIDDPLAASVDVIGINSYCGWYSETPENCSKMRWSSDHNKPMIMSECGAGALQGNFGDERARFTEEHQALIYRNNIEMFENISPLRGVSPWILKDFRSPRRPLPNLQDFWNRKGLISDRGIKKQAFYVMQAWYRDLEARWETE